LFERFINPMQPTIPDIDIDFSVRGREHVIEHLRETYGDDSTRGVRKDGPRAAQQSTVGRTLRGPWYQQ